eukprot:NODE_3134_length_825_cov_248.094805.p2 GENE.NODE_3134_length_825_cov_248.094805~~NODE_3134_length_825_cov_248.094805.p2  ORF type:complete len:227 (-),score=38.72 NODE_3134_length_825_cov_248.094805:85-765(-)
MGRTRGNQREREGTRGDQREPGEPQRTRGNHVERAAAIVEGQLLGMVAAQANRLELRSLAEAPCAYAWSRLPGHGGHEVAELTAAAAKLGCEDARFFRFAVADCAARTIGFTCLRDVALAAVSLQHHTQDQGQVPFNRVHAFAGLATAALLRKQGGEGVRTPPCDLAEFLYALAQVLTARPLDGGTPLREVPVVIVAVATATVQAHRGMPRASPQDYETIPGAYKT